ncbi:amino acid/polyamine transporter I [Dactylonectria estremocensis]|uniref:Amino acid/polyamine transporter I n=1 Tax=Dactylonectria estremocensis TaxID=1079267 RepID=A0A9P9EYT0_9HYPO|nr:amino acid/polyamine transporter I [Dactylonectria estremocensis]
MLEDNTNTTMTDSNGGKRVKADQIDGSHQKPFTVLSALGIGYGTTNTAVGLIFTVATTLSMGGSPLFFWGFLLMALVGLGTAVSLAELVSAMPHPGGQHVWVQKLSPPGPRRFLSYLTAIMNWFGAVLTSASVCLAVPLGAVAIITFLNPDFQYRPWMGFLGYQLLNVLTLMPACFESALPRISKGLLVLTISSMLATFICLFAMAPARASAAEFFTATKNTSGWPNGVAFFVGLNGANWSFSCLDVIVHIANEIPQPRTNAPKALMLTIIVGLGSGMLILLAILVNLPDVDPTVDTSILLIYYRICNNNQAAAVGLWLLPLISGVGTVWAIHTWQSRLAWSLSRQGGFPFASYLGSIAPSPFRTPIWSLIWSSLATSIFGCLYLGSQTAFNSLVSAGILLQYLSYSIPVILMLCHGRSSFNHGPFWLPRLGYVANFFMLCWMSLALVFYCFPYFTPIETESMNYVSVVLIAIFVFTALMWLFHARHYYKGLE